LELAFETKLLREICESEQKARQELGIKVAEALKRRLADLRAATSVEDLPVAKPRKNSGTCVVDLPQGYRLVFVPNHTKNPMLKPRTVDWARVGRIKILRIENTDGR
jgi:hypothetical protein